MQFDSCKITIHMVSSLDGFIAKKDNSISWFETTSHYENGVSLTEEEKWAFLKDIDCYIMGANTYEHALELSKNYGWAYGATPVIVLTHRNLPVQNPHIEFYSGDPEKLVNERIKPNYKNAWLAGGAMLAGEFLRLQLADEIRISVLPVILGEGLKFFDNIAEEQALDPGKVTAYKNGIVELRYEIKKSTSANGKKNQ